MLYFIVNESARTGKSADSWKRIEAVLRERKIPYIAKKTEYEGHAGELAKEFSGRDVKIAAIVVVGGDGTVNEVLNGISDFGKVRLGVIPNGSGNDFARGLKLEKNPIKNLDRILEAEKRGWLDDVRMDLGQVRWDGCEKPRLFAISAGVGLDALVCKKAMHSNVKRVLNRLHLGKLTYLFLTVQSLFSMKTSDIAASFDKKKAAKQEKLIFAAAMNLRAEGGGVPMAPSADCIDGKLSVCSAYGIPKWRTFFCLPLLVAARHERIKGFTVKDCESARLISEEPMTLHADGEYIADVREVEFSCLPGKLHIMGS